MKLGIVDVGGGLRDIYSAGVLDRLMDEGIRADLCIGVSAGSANLATYLAGQRGRLEKFYTEYTFRPEYMSMKNFLRLGSYIDLDYPYSTLSNEGGEFPLDYDAIAANPAEFIVVASDADSGMAKYFTKADISRNNYDVMKASSAIPFVCRPYPIGGRRYFDGALADPVPVIKALDEGCDRVIVLLSKPKDTPRAVGRDELFASLISREFPLAAKNLILRARRYNASVEKAKELEKAGKVLILAPDDTCGVDTLTRDRAALLELYGKGFRDGERILDFVK